MTRRPMADGILWGETGGGSRNIGRPVMLESQHRQGTDQKAKMGVLSLERVICTHRQLYTFRSAGVCTLNPNLPPALKIEPTTEHELTP